MWRRIEFHRKLHEHLPACHMYMVPSILYHTPRQACCYCALRIHKYTCRYTYNTHKYYIHILLFCTSFNSLDVVVIHPIQRPYIFRVSHPPKHPSHPNTHLHSHSVLLGCIKCFSVCVLIHSYYNISPLHSYA